MTQLKIGFAGTPAFGLPALDALFHTEHQLVAVYTQPDRPAGRGRKVQPSPIKSWALEHHIPVYQPINFKNDEDVQIFNHLNLDLLIVIAYGLILPTRILNSPRLGCINVHASLLPRWRGASPIQQAILHGDKETGVAIMQMDKGLDTGNVFTMVSTPIALTDNAATLHDKLAQLSITPLLETIRLLSISPSMGQPQNHELATYAPKINKEDAKIHWQDSAKVIDQKIRAFNPWPIAYTAKDETTFRIHQAHARLINHSAQPGTILSITSAAVTVATGEGVVEITQLQFPGSKVLWVKDWYHSNRELKVGAELQ